ncbi:MAG: PAS domain S-box protein, partial [Candidatus Thorarchaeota archaeon]
LFETIVDLFTSTLIQHKAISDLHESEERFRTFAEQSLIGVMIIKRSGDITFVNEELASIAEYPISEIYRNKFVSLSKKIFSEKDRLELQEKTCEMIQNLTSISAEYLISSKNNKKKWISIYVAPITKEKNYVGAGIVVLDITEEKRAIMTIERERQAFHIIAEATINAKDIPDLCQRILFGLTETLQYDIGTFRLFNEKTRMLNPIAIAMTDKNRIAEIKPISIDNQTYLNTHVARTKEPVFAPDVTKNEVAMNYIDRLEKFEAKANITWPIVNANNDLIGTLQIVSNTPKELSNEDKFFFETIVRFFSSALEMKRSEEALQHSEEKYRVLVETIPNSLALFDIHGDILVVNKHSIDIYGAKSEHEILGRSVYSFFPENEQKSAHKLVEELFKTGSIIDREIPQVKIDGTKFTAEASITLIYDDQGVPIMAMSILDDVTNRKKIEKEQQRLYNIISNSDEVIISANPDGEIIYVNPAVFTVFGYSPDELIGKNISILAPKGSEVAQKEMIRSAIQNKKATFETVRLAKNGSLIPIIINITVNRDDEGKIISTNAMLVDISDIKKSEENLKEQLLKYEILYKITSAVYQKHDKERFFETILQIIIDKLGFSGGALFLFDESTKKFEIKKTLGIQNKIAKHISSLLIDSKQNDGLFAKGETITSEDILERDKWLLNLNANDFIYTPISLNNKIIGALTLLFTDKEKISLEKEKLLELLSKDLGELLSNFE